MSPESERSTGVKAPIASDLTSRVNAQTSIPRTFMTVQHRRVVGSRSAIRKTLPGTLTHSQLVRADDLRLFGDGSSLTAHTLKTRCANRRTE